MGISVSINEQKITEEIVKRIANYWNGREIPVSGGVGEQWSDWESKETTTTDPETGETTTTRTRVRTEGTHDRVTAIKGVISASANGTNIDFEITYNFQISNVG